MNRIVVSACVALGTVGTLAAAMSGATAGEKASTIFTERDLVVTLVTPTINQEVTDTLSDPGLKNQITVRFSSMLNPRDIIDDQNVVNRLSPKVEFLDSKFARLPGTPQVRRNVFIFNPFSVVQQVLAPGQYTLNLKSSIRNTRGSLLNNGLADYTATFSVGTDLHAPVLRRISPINGQTGIGLNQTIVATFNEPIDPASILTTVTVQDASTNPPTAIPGVGGGTGVSLARHGFDIVFTPDPCFGYPPKTNIQFLMKAQGQTAQPQPAPLPPIPPPVQASTVTDVFQNKFVKDAGLQWTVDTSTPTLFHSPNGDFDDFNGQFRLTFQTKGTRPAPQGLRPGGPMMAYPPPYASPCAIQLWLAPSCEVSGNCLHYTTSTGLGELDLRGFITRFNQGITDYSLITILPNAPVRLGRPAGATFDPRILGPASAFAFHTYIYVVDERTGTVEIVRSDNFKIIGRLAGFSSPRDVSVSTNTGISATTLYVSNFGSNQLIAVDLEGITVSFTGQPGNPSPCEAIKDNQSHRAFISVGAGPTEVSADCYLQQRVMVCNSLEGSISVVDVKTNKLLKTYDVGSNPVSCDWNTIQFGGIRVACIANQGGLPDPSGSVSMFINSPPLGGGFLGAGQVRDGVESALTDGIKNPTFVWGNQKWIDPPPPFGTLTSVPIVWWVANTGGDTSVDLRLNITGLFGLSISPTTRATLKVGLNPTSSVMDAFYPNFIAFSSVIGTGSVTAANPQRSIDPTSIPVPGVRRLVNCYTN